VGTVVDDRLSSSCLVGHCGLCSKLPRSVPRVPIRPLLVTSLENIKPSHRLWFSNPRDCPRLPSSEHLFPSGVGHFVSLCHLHFLTHPDEALAWQAKGSKTLDGKNPAAAVRVAAALPSRRSKGGSPTNANEIPHHDCAPYYAAAVRRQQAVAPARLSTPAGSTDGDSAPPPTRASDHPLT